MSINHPSVFALLLILHAGASATQEVNIAHTSDYAGWIYFDSGQDMPIRLHRTDDAGLASLDLPVYNVGGLAATIAEPTDRGLRILAHDVIGFEVEFTVQTNAASPDLIGRTKWTGQKSTLEGDVYLHRSAVPLPWVPLTDVPDASGVYPLSSSHSIIITRRPWGELFYTDHRSGRTGYLFAQSPTTFFAGSASYVPSGVTAIIDLHVDDEGQVTEITWREPAGTPIRATRTEFVTESVHFRNGAVELAGEITRLSGEELRPGIVLIGGSDWDTASGMRGYANLFASYGFIVLTFDKRGHGKSGGETVASFSVIASDVTNAAEFLAAQKDVANSTVGIFGYSRAGWHIPLAASMSEAIGYAIMFVPPAVSPAVQETTRRLAELRENGIHDPSDLEFAQQYLGKMWSFARTGEGGDAYLRQRDEIERRGWLDALGGSATLDESEWLWSRLNAHYDPLPALRNMTCPVLAVFGGADSNVTPEQNLPLMRDAFREGGNCDVILEVIPEADHGLRMSQPNARPHQHQSYPPGLWPMVHQWLVEHAGIENRQE